MTANDQIPPDAWIAARLAERAAAAARTALELGVFFHAFVAAACATELVGATSKWILGPAHLAALAATAVWYWRRAHANAAAVVLFNTVMVLAAHAYVLHYDVRHLTPVHYLKSWSAFFIIAEFAILMTPFQRLSAQLALAAAAFAAGAACLAAHPQGWRLSGVLGFALGATVLVKRMLVASARRETRLEHDAMRARLASERASFDRELELGARIQSSFQPAPSFAHAGYELAFETPGDGPVGGDWYAYHVTPSEAFVLVVEAAGRGVHAALVVHAVQALWAAALGAESFAPDAWLRRVNATLLTLGRGSPHRAHVGVARLADGRATCWGGLLGAEAAPALGPTEASLATAAALQPGARITVRIARRAG